MNAPCPDDAEGVPAAAVTVYPKCLPANSRSLGLLQAAGLREEDGDAEEGVHSRGGRKGGSVGGLLELIAVAMAPHPSGEAGGSAYPPQVSRPRCARLQRCSLRSTSTASS